MDNLERAGRVLAQAFGYGSSWHPNNSYGTERAWNPDGGEKTRRVQLGGKFETDRISDHHILPIRKEVRRASEKREPSIPGVSELKRWSGEYLDWDKDRKRVRHVVGPKATAITPQVGPSDRAMIALAGIDKPLQSILMVYALTDGRHWPPVERYARERLPQSAHAGIEEAMFRVLKCASHRGRAKHLRMRETAYVDMIRPALCLFDDCLHRAADEFMTRYGQAERLLKRVEQLSE